MYFADHNTTECLSPPSRQTILLPPPSIPSDWLTLSNVSQYFLGGCSSLSLINSSLCACLTLREKRGGTKYARDSASPTSPPRPSTSRKSSRTSSILSTFHSQPRSPAICEVLSRFVPKSAMRCCYRTPCCHYRASREKSDRAHVLQ